MEQRVDGINLIRKSKRQLGFTKVLLKESLDEILMSAEKQFDKHRFTFLYDVSTKEEWWLHGHGERELGSCSIPKDDRDLYIDINLEISKRKPNSFIVSDEHVVRSLIAVFHELRHANQAVTAITDSRDEKTIIHYLSNVKNNLYYEQKYEYDLMELDAEANAVKRTYFYLKNSLNVSETDTMRLLNEYLRRSEPFLSYEGAYASISEIMEAFEALKEEAATIAGVYEDFEDVQVEEGYIEDAFLHIVKLSDKDGRWAPFWDKFTQATSQFESDRMVLAVTYHAYPDDFNIYSARLSQMDLSPKTVFGIPDWPETTEEIQNRNPDYVNKLKMSTKNEEISEEICPVITDKDLEGLDDDNGPVR